MPPPPTPRHAAGNKARRCSKAQRLGLTTTQQPHRDRGQHQPAVRPALCDAATTAAPSHEYQQALSAGSAWPAAWPDRRAAAAAAATAAAAAVSSRVAAAQATAPRAPDDAAAPRGAHGVGEASAAEAARAFRDVQPQLQPLPPHPPPPPHLVVACTPAVRSGRHEGFQRAAGPWVEFEDPFD